MTVKIMTLSSMTIIETLSIIDAELNNIRDSDIKHNYTLYNDTKHIIYLV
jgi:hypothetical protein